MQAVVENSSRQQEQLTTLPDVSACVLPLCFTRRKCAGSSFVVIMDQKKKIVRLFGKKSCCTKGKSAG
jgi:hypothetical protein